MSRAARHLPLPLVLLAIFFSVNAAGQSAAGSGGLSLSLDPPRLELAMEAGAEKTESLEISNSGRTRLGLKLYSLPFSVDAAGQVATGRPVAGPRDASGWLRVNPGEAVIEPGESVVVRLTARAPKEADGTYWAILFAESLPPRAPAEAPRAPEPMSVGLRVGSYVYVQVGKPPASSVDLSLSMAASNSGFEAVGEAVHRSGGLLRLRARWRVIPGGGGARSIDEEDFALFPGGRRVLRFRPEHALKPTDRVELLIDGPSIRLRREVPVGGGASGR